FWIDASDASLQAMAWLGTGLALLVLLGYANGLLMAFLWALYMSFVHIGQDWYGYGWEIQLLETGFLAIFLCPLLDGRPFPRRPPRAPGVPDHADPERQPVVPELPDHRPDPRLLRRFAAAPRAAAAPRGPGGTRRRRGAPLPPAGGPGRGAGRRRGAAQHRAGEEPPVRAPGDEHLVQP